MAEELIDRSRWLREHIGVMLFFLFLFILSALGAILGVPHLDELRDDEERQHRAAAAADLAASATSTTSTTSSPAATAVSPTSVAPLDDEAVADATDRLAQLLGTCAAEEFAVAFEPLLEIPTNGYEALDIAITGPALADEEPEIELAGDGAVLAVALVSIERTGDQTWTMLIDHVTPFPVGPHVMFVDVTIDGVACSAPLALHAFEYAPAE